MSQFFSLGALDLGLATTNPQASAVKQLIQLIDTRVDDLPLPGHGDTRVRWQALAHVAAHDLSLAKLYEGHTDARAILAELGARDLHQPGSVWGVWAAESPQARALLDRDGDGTLRVRGGKAWCSGAGSVSHGLLTAWFPDARGPQLVALDMDQPEVTVDDRHWRAVGMEGSVSFDIRLEGAKVQAVGDIGDYLRRPGFWHGGAGIAACWYGGAVACARALHHAVKRAPSSDSFRLAALGTVDLQLRQTAALLREAADWIDAHPKLDARTVATRVRLAAEACATKVLDAVGRTLGAGPYCRDADFARTAADLPVFIRQSHAERDLASLGTDVSSADAGWEL